MLFIFMAVFCLYTGNAYASSETEDTDLSMEVSYGFDNTAKSDRYLRVTVLLNTGTKPFDGTLEFLTEQSSLDIYNYSYVLSLAAGEKQKKDYYIPLGVRADQMYVSVKDNAGKTVVQKRLKLGNDEYSIDSYIGIFADAPEKLSYFDGAGVRYGSIKTDAVFLNSQNAPDDRRGYDQLDFVVVSGFDLDTLDDAQYDALYEWIENGGTILFGGGTDYRKNYGRFSEKVLEHSYLGTVNMPINFDIDSESEEQMREIQAECVDVNLKNGITLLAGDRFPVMSYTSLKKGRIVAASFSMDAIAKLCMANSEVVEKLYTLILGDNAVEELTQEDYYGYSGAYYNVQNLVNSGNVSRMPNVAAYTVVIVIYLLLIGPGIYFYLKKRGIYRYYLPIILLFSFWFTGVVYSLGVKTRFKDPFVTYASILDTSDGKTEEEIYINIRSPYNKQYSVSLNPSYEIRPITRNYYYDSVSTGQFTGNEDYYTSLTYRSERVDVRIKENVAFSPNLFTLHRDIEKTDTMGIESSISYFDGRISGTVKNCFDEPVENVALLIDGKVMLLGNMEPGQTVELDGIDIINYPLNYSYAAAQMITGADQHEEMKVEDQEFLKAQERTKLLSFYLDSNTEKTAGSARFVAFRQQKDHEGNDILADSRAALEGYCMLTESVSVNCEKDGEIYRSALEETPKIISGNYDEKYNTLYTANSSETATVEYSLGSDLVIDKLKFENVSSQFLDNPLYPYISLFSGKMYFYNYETGQNDLIEFKKEYSANELSAYLSPSNTLTVKYVAESTEEYGMDSQLPRIYVVGRKY